MLQATVKYFQLGLPASTTDNNKKIESQRPEKHLPCIPPSFSWRTERIVHLANYFRFPQDVKHRTAHVFAKGPYVVQLANYFRFPKYVNHQTTHVYASGPYVVQLANYFRFPENLNKAAVISADSKIANKTPRAHVSSIVPPVFVCFSSQIHTSYHLQRKAGYSSSH